MQLDPSQSNPKEQKPLDHISDLESLFIGHYSGLCAFAFRILKDPAVAEDIVQDVFLKLWRDRHTLTFSTSTQYYLYLATKNLSLNYLQKQRRRSELLDIYLEDIRETMSNIEEFVYLRELNQNLGKAIEHLPPKCREIFILSRHQYKSHKEIAAELGISVKTVENQVGKALKILRELLKDFLLAEMLIGVVGGLF